MSKSIQEQHTMVIASQHSDGTQEWVCPTCGRRILMQWPPQYRRIVLEAGDESASHSGSLGVQHVSQAAVESAIEDKIPAESLDMPCGEADENDPYLAPWISWLEGQSF